MTARPLYKADVEARQAERILRLETKLKQEREARITSDKNAARFHALMLQARINLIRQRKNTP